MFIIRDDCVTLGAPNQTGFMPWAPLMKMCSQDRTPDGLRQVPHLNMSEQTKVLSVLSSHSETIFSIGQLRWKDGRKTQRRR